MNTDKVLKKIIQEVNLLILNARPRGKWIESDITLRTGKTAKFGSSQHVKELERLIADLDRVRSRQSTGSASRAHISSAIAAVRKELKNAQKKYDQAHPALDIEEEV